MILSNEEITTIFNGIQDSILILSPEQVILDANDAFIRQMDLAREDVIGQKCYEIFTERHQKNQNCRTLCPLEKAVTNRRPCRMQLKRPGRKGQPRDVEVSISPIWNEKGEITKFIEISRDITPPVIDDQTSREDLVRMLDDRNRRLSAALERLLHQDKMASLGKLSSAVVHEINNPVAGILNLVKLCQRILKEEAVSQAGIDLFIGYLNLMETETRRMSGIINNLLMFARQSTMELIPCDINELLDQTLMLNANLLKINHIKLDTRFAKDLPKIKGSADQLKQVFMNIISNAAEGMAATNGGTLTVTTMAKPEQRGVSIKFKDTGPGIPKVIINNIFEPFFTTKKKGKGVGLGLSVVYDIIEKHDGTIDVESRQGEGAEFSILLFENEQPATASAT